MAADRLERLTDLLAVLLHTYEPLTLEQIRQALEESSADPYPEGESGRRQFERDKALLREQGIEVTTEYPEGLGGGVAAYRIRPEDYELPGLGLTADEQVALNLAYAAVRVGGTDWTETAGWKLSATDLDVSRIEPGPPMSLTGLDALPTLEEAVTQQQAVDFVHDSKDRTVDAWRLLFREHYWYLCGHYHQTDEHRFFRVDRIDPDSIEVAGPWSRTPPDGYDAAAELPEPRLMGDETVTATVAVDAVVKDRVSADLGHPEPVGTTADGWTVLPVEVAHRPSFRSWLLGHLDHVRLEGPADLRDEIVNWLQDLAEAR